MARKTSTNEHMATVSSSISSNTVEMKLRTLIGVAVAIILIALSFYGGYLYGSGSRHHANSSAILSAQRKFAIGLVVYIAPGSITISNQNDTGSQTFTITNRTLISINGRKAPANQIKGGDVVLIRELKNSPTTASVILVNSHFSG